MTLPTAEEITNLYLYGKKTKPTDITASSIISPRNNAKSTVDGDE